MVVHATWYWNTDDYELDYGDTNLKMCKNTIKLCNRCVDTRTIWSECTDFEAYKTEHRDTTMSPMTSDWISKHGAVQPSKIEIVIAVVVCPKCKASNKAKSPTSKLVESVETITSPLAGNVTIKNEAGNDLMSPWFKGNHQPIVTDTETETETESDTETEVEN